MKIKMLQTTAGPAGCFRIGREYQVSAEEAASFLANKLAVEVVPAVVEKPQAKKLKAD